MYSSPERQRTATVVVRLGPVVPCLRGAGRPPPARGPVDYCAGDMPITHSLSIRPISKRNAGPEQRRLGCVARAGTRCSISNLISYYIFGAGRLGSIYQ